MGFIGGTATYHLLRLLFGSRGRDKVELIPPTRSKLDLLFGSSVWNDVRGRTVIDFGCGTGAEAIELAQRGADRVIGIDARESVLRVARELASRSGVSDRCSFTTHCEDRADVIFSVDAFEHFADPAGVLKIMRRLVKDDGTARVCFGPTWYHPRGGHLFSVFPWAHLLFTEEALVRWRSGFKADGATRFSEVEGGLNGMTIRRFQALVEMSDWRFEDFEAVPIQRLRLLANKLTREFFTSMLRCRLVPRTPRPMPH